MTSVLYRDVLLYSRIHFYAVCVYGMQFYLYLLVKLHTIDT